jgi:PKHD-type hydroxylase
MFWRIPELLSPAEASSFVAALSGDTVQWVDGRVTAGHQGAQVKHNQQLDESSRLARELGSRIVGLLERHPLFISAVLPNRLYPPLFNRFAPGMQFGMHVDGSVRTIAATGEKLRTDLSATLFLTPPDAYDGGELLVETELERRRAKFAAGDLLVYSATARHRVTEVKRGTRLAAVFWIQSLVRDDQNRERLFELDRTIQSLTQAQAAPEALLSLTSLYHGLLKLWTDL